MPIAANKVSISNTGILRVAKDMLVLNLASLTHLSWGPGVCLARAKAGQQAGAFNEQSRHWVVGLRGHVVYCRHVVWMLTNDSPLPDGTEVIHADGNRHNLNPGNLKLVPLADVATGKVSVCDRHKSARSEFPQSFRIRDIGRGLYVGELFLDRTWQIMDIASDRPAAVTRMAIILHVFGVTPALIHTKLDRSIVNDLLERARRVWPQPRTLTNAEQTQLSDMRAALVAEVRNAIEQQTFGNQSIDVVKHRKALALTPKEGGTAGALPSRQVRNDHRTRNAQRVEVPDIPASSKVIEAKPATDADLNAIFGDGFADA